MMSDEELKSLVAGLAVAQKETDRQLNETRLLLRDKTAATDRQLKELGKQIGGLGNKFGSFTEGLALPSMTKILRERFKMEVISPRVSIRKNGDHLEIDVLAFANSGIDMAIVVEVKSHLDDGAIEQTLNIMQKFYDYLPEHRGKSLIGILAFVHAAVQMKQKAMNAGLYLAEINDETFKLAIPEEFKPKVYKYSQ